MVKVFEVITLEDGTEELVPLKPVPKEAPPRLSKRQRAVLEELWKQTRAPSEDYVL